MNIIQVALKSFITLARAILMKGMSKLIYLGL